MHRRQTMWSSSETTDCAPWSGIVLTVLVVATVGFAPQPASAATMTYMELSELVDVSDVVVRGEVRDRRTFRDEDRGGVYTRTTIEVSETYFGAKRSTVTIEQFGGTYQGTTHSVPGDAKFHDGEEVVVFLDTGRDPETKPYFLVGLAQSKFRVVRESDGSGASVVRDLRAVQFVSDDGATRLELPNQQSWSLASFEATLNALAYEKARDSRGRSNGKEESNHD